MSLFFLFWWSLTGYGELLQEISCSRMSVKFATGKPLDQRYGLYMDFMLACLHCNFKWSNKIGFIHRLHYFGELKFVKVYFQGRWALILFLPGRSHGGQLEQLKPDVLLRLTLGGLTLTLLQDDPPSQPDGSSSLAQVSQVFFRELGFFKDSMFSERDFHHLKVGFAKACPLSHLRYKKRKWNFLHRHRWTQMNGQKSRDWTCFTSSCCLPQHPVILMLFHRVTGAAVQVTCELRSGRRNNRAITSDLSFSRLELLECLWEDGKPQYTEVDVTVTLTLGLCTCTV